MYAQAKDMCEKDVTEAMVAASEEGVEGWASKGLEVGARSAVGQAIARAFQKNPAAKHVYKWLTEDLKRKFRISWGVSRSFETVLKKRARAPLSAS